jgi:hypothetical protein
VKLPLLGRITGRRRGILKKPRFEPEFPVLRNNGPIRDFSALLNPYASGTMMVLETHTLQELTFPLRGCSKTYSFSPTNKFGWHEKS